MKTMIPCLIALTLFTELGMDHIPYYEEERNDRYLAYQEENPDLSLEEVLWRVNVDLDAGEGPCDGWLVNKEHGLAKDYVPEDLVEAAPGKYLVREAAAAFLRMQDAAQAAGCPFTLVSAYRSYSYQLALHQKYLNQYGAEKADLVSARAGHSEHQTGRAVDLCGENWDMNRFGESKAGAWAVEHAYEYGFIIRYTAENQSITGYRPELWHLTYVGIEAATVMHMEEISSFEEYWGKQKSRS